MKINELTNIDLEKILNHEQLDKKLDEISEFQNLCEKKLNLCDIPELTYELFRFSLDHNKLYKELKWITKNSDPIRLSDWYSNMLDCSIIPISPDNYDEIRWKWKIIYDERNEMYWKVDIKNDCVEEYYVNYLLND